MSKADKILFVTLSNIGDAILTLPALDYLRKVFPQARITVLTGPRPKEIFQENPFLEQVIVYDKRGPLKEKIGLLAVLKAQHFDCVVDLRNSYFGWLLAARLKIPVFLKIPPAIKHMQQRHLFKVTAMLGERVRVLTKPESGFLQIKPQDGQYIEKILQQNNIKPGERIVVVSPGARSHTKRWEQEKFEDLILKLAKEPGIKIVLVGDKEDALITGQICSRLKRAPLDLAGRTNLPQLSSLLKKAELLISNDSAVMHLASYLGTPVVAVFGPSDDLKYGPWSRGSVAVRKEIFCRPCEKAQCRFKTLECLQRVSVEDVWSSVKEILFLRDLSGQEPRENYFKRILIMRTDRIGDVLLSTPVIKALREAYPYSYLAMMVSPYAREIVEGNPYLDEVILYDKDSQHKSWISSFKLARQLASKRFDLAIILHPTNRVHLLAYLCGIPMRIGYDRKFGFLLTNRLKHLKQRGEKHELDYNLDMVEYLGIEPKSKQLFMPIKEDSEQWVKVLLEKSGISFKDKLLGLHPGASCPSKVWPLERFAEVADRLADKYGFKVIIVSGKNDSAKAKVVAQAMKSPAVNLAGETSLSQLACLLKRCALFISNDSGPVHLAVAVGVPVISIFGRQQAGLSPKRWGPLGAKDKVLHKSAGCIECLAHNCVKSFACLKAITVEDVITAAESVFKAG